MAAGLKLRPGTVLTAGLLACPLFAWPGSGYDALRLPLVLGLTTLLLVTAFLRAARGGDRPPGPAPLRTAGLLLLGVHLLSLIVARSIADAAAPILILFAGVAIFACLRGGVVRREEGARLMPVISAVGLVVAAIGIGQWFCKGEAISTEGNRNYAGTLAAMLAPVALSAVWSGRTWSRVLAGISTAALTALLGLSESRGGALALLAGFLVVLGTMAAKRLVNRRRIALVALLAVAGVAAMLLPSRPMSAERMETAGLRLNIWKSGIRMVARHPLLGWGSGGFSTEYPPFRSEAEFRYSDKTGAEGFKELEDAHSSWVQTAVETGAIGLLSLLLVVYVAARLWRYYVKQSTDPESGAILAGLGGGAAAYLVAGFFNALTLKTSHSVLFWIVLGLIELVGDTRPWRQAARSREWKVAVPAAAAFVALFGAIWAGALGLADRAYTEGMLHERAELREPKLREALDTNPWHWRARYELARTLSSVRRFRGAVDEGRATLKLRPHHVGALNNTAVWILQSEGDVKEAESLLRRAIEIAPFYYLSHYNLGLLEGRRENFPEARRCFTKAIEHNPRAASSYYCRGALTYAGGGAAEAVEDFRKARGQGFDVGAALRTEYPATLNDPKFAEFFR